MTNLKPGDKVRYKGGCEGIADHKINDKGTVLKNGTISYGEDGVCKTPSCWEKIEERKEITFDNLQVGDVVVSENKIKMTIKYIEKYYFLECDGNYRSIIGSFTKEKFEKEYSILQPQAEEEMTIEQATEALSKALGKKVKIVK